MDQLASASVFGWPSAAATTFGLIFLAEIGDKSQLVCMALAARHHHRPVLMGALAAFVVLNVLAVVFGAGLAHWVPEPILAVVVGILFAVFGVLSLRAEGEEGDAETRQYGDHGVFAATFLMLLLAEMGDKTQLAVAGMAGTLPALPVWIGATLALGATSALAVILGRKLLRCIPLRRLRQVGGVFFLILAALALSNVF